MVQYVFTPWRDRQELLLVRQQLYALSGAEAGPRIGHDGGGGGDDDQGARQRRQDQHRAVARVSMWMQRGHCPHMVESTAMLMAALLIDKEADPVQQGSSSTYAIRSAYSAAFSRFVTGLLDSHQDKQRKQSMYAVAKTIGLPATFVELRHQSTHEQLPSRAKLRSAAVKALDWIWHYYWVRLARDEKAPADLCAAAIRRYLREDDEGEQRKAVGELQRFETARVLRTIDEVRGMLPGNLAYLKCVKLSHELAAGKKHHTAAGGGGAECEVSQMKAEAEKRRADAVTRLSIAQESSGAESGPDADVGWSLYPGPWKPKPIGVV